LPGFGEPQYGFNIHSICIGYSQKIILPGETINWSKTIKDVLDRMLVKMKKKIV